ncbi:kinesin-associated microtubule-binding domain-containing protein [Phthorimaea operculella]|nr:kinesin-associated microtubule-binding domain-containing protein [Phthorimaea operculella]
MERDKRVIEERMARQLATIQAERDETERRLQEMHSQMEQMFSNVRTTLHESVARHVSELEEQKKLYEQSTAKALELQRKELETVRKQKEEADLGLEECEGEAKQCLDNVDKYDKEFGEGTHAINAEMEAFSHSVTQIVGHTNDMFMNQLNNTKATIEQTAGQVIEADRSSTQEQISSTRAAVHTVVHSANETLSTVVTKAEETTTTSLETINNVTDRSSRLATAALRMQAAQTDTLAEATSAIHNGSESLRQEINVQADMEGRYLMKEYRVYSPTGNTPARKEYRYPRRLAATSPHDRILARLRQQQRERAVRSPDIDSLVWHSVPPTVLASPQFITPPFTSSQFDINNVFNTKTTKDSSPNEESAPLAPNQENNQKIYGYRQPRRERRLKLSTSIPEQPDLLFKMSRLDDSNQ